MGFEKECLKDLNVGGTQKVYGQEVPVQESPIGAFVFSVYHEIERLQQSTGIVCGVTDRLTGVEAEAEESMDDSAKRTEPDCEFEKLSRALQDLAKAINLMGCQANRLSDKV